MSDGVLQRYRAQVRSGALRADTAQALAAEQLQLLALRLADFRPGAGGFLRSFFAAAPSAPKGLYLFGGVGVGKTMLMDMFFDSVDFAPKQRLHFHEFMMSVHGAIGAHRRRGEPDPIPHVGRELVRRARLLCLDELQISDITDAMIVGRLFGAMFAEGLVLVATSNQAPRDLYKDGLNRDLFLPFVDLIERHMEVLELAAARDYRAAKLQATQRYFTPLDAEAARGMEAAWQALTAGSLVLPAALNVGGRVLEVPVASCGVARFDFADLCARPVGAHDYLALSERFHTLFLENVPVMGPEEKNEARRFMMLIDTLYDRGVQLIVSAAAEPDQLYPQGPGAESFRRTASRLMEMRSRTYARVPRRTMVECE